MTTKQKTAVVTGASRGIGAATANLFLERGYNVVANSRNITRNSDLRRSDNLALVDGDIALATTGEKIVATAIKQFGSLDVLVNHAGRRSGAFVHESGRLHLHDPTGRQADGRAEERR